MAHCNPFVSAAVEGPLDAAVAARIIETAGGAPAQIYVRRGKRALLQRAAAYNNAARFAPWLVLVDLDSDAECAPPARNDWLPQPAMHMCFRVAVREVEAWLLSDRAAIARFLAVPIGRVPSHPESLADPKQEVVRLATASRSRAIREDIVPRPNSGRTVGPAYSSRMIEFVRKRWSVKRACQLCHSLAGALACLRRVLQS
jgi:hypothetical protein